MPALARSVDRNAVTARAQPNVPRDQRNDISGATVLPQHDHVVLPSRDGGESLLTVKEAIWTKERADAHRQFGVEGDVPTLPIPLKLPDNSTQRSLLLSRALNHLLSWCPIYNSNPNACAEFQMTSQGKHDEQMSIRFPVSQFSRKHLQGQTSPLRGTQGIKSKTVNSQCHHLLVPIMD